MQGRRYSLPAQREGYFLVVHEFFKLKRANITILVCSRNMASLTKFWIILSHKKAFWLRGSTLISKILGNDAAKNRRCQTLNYKRCRKQGQAKNDKLHQRFGEWLQVEFYLIL